MRPNQKLTLPILYDGAGPNLIKIEVYFTVGAVKTMLGLYTQWLLTKTYALQNFI